MSINIHPTAVVSKNAELADGVIIGPYCIVDDKVKIGEGTELKPFVHVCDYTTVGKNCTIMEHANIGAAPQDLSYRGEVSYVVIGDRVTCREFVTVNRAAGEENSTVIGNDVLLMESVHVAHNVVIGNNITVANKTGIAGHVHIDDFAVIGGMSGFHQFVHIGKYCMIGAMSRVVQDIPPFCLASGDPIKVYDINKVGLRRRGFEENQRTAIRRMYKLIYGSHLTVREGLAELEKQYGEMTEAKEILDFAANATRGFAQRVKLTGRKEAQS